MHRSKPKLVNKEFSERLKSWGFDSRFPLFEVSVDFDEKFLRKSLFESKAASSYLLPLKIEYTPTDEWKLPMVVESIQAVFTPYAVGVNETPTGLWDEPEWVVRGFLYKSVFDPDHKLVRMQIYIQTNSEGSLDLGYLQVLRNPMDVSLGSRIIWGEGAPGQPT